jgi:hypothetical protein
MDAVAGLLDGPRARGAFLLRSMLDPPWSLRIEDEAPLTVMAIVRGSAWVLPDGGDPVPVHAGDVAIFRGPDHYTVASHPAAAPQVAILPGQECVVLNPSGEVLVESLGYGVRTWGNTAEGQTVMLTGTYQLDGAVSQRLLRALPALIVLRDQDWDSPIIPLLAAEIIKDEPGQEAVLDRLLDLLLIAVLRAWFARPEADAPDWYRASSDPIVGHALARRFNDLVGEPPMTFLTGWRIALAADLLLEPGATIASVADQVGYSSPFALSTAFKRLRGISPQQHRTAA